MSVTRVSRCREGCPMCTPNKDDAPMMLTTSMAVLALSGLLNVNLAVQTTWQTDYKVALTLSVKEHKPLAVFITKGATNTLAQLPEAAAKVLNANYIAVTINSDDATGKKLAEAFEMTEGVVISDATGATQALRIEGQTNPSDLPQTLERLAHPSQVPATTEVYGAAPVVTATPIVTAAPVYAPAPSIASTIVPSYYTPAPACKNCQQQQQYRR